MHRHGSKVSLQPAELEQWVTIPPAAAWKENAKNNSVVALELPEAAHMTGRGLHQL